jgi:hypothetical protein
MEEIETDSDIFGDVSPPFVFSAQITNARTSAVPYAIKLFSLAKCRATGAT